MKTETISFDVSEDILVALEINSVELSQKVRLLAAIEYFKSKQLSLGKAAELAGINSLEFMDILGKEGIVIFDYDEIELESELIGIAQLQLE